MKIIEKDGYFVLVNKEGIELTTSQGCPWIQTLEDAEDAFFQWQIQNGYED